MKFAEELKSIKSGKKELREFGFVMAVACAIFGGISLWRNGGAWPWWFGAGAAFLLPALAVPAALAVPQKAWMTLALMMGWVMTRVILAALFFGVLTPIGLVLRATGRRLLNLELEPSSSSYWCERDHSKKSLASYERQF